MSPNDIARMLANAAAIWDDAANHRPTVTADDDWAGFFAERRREDRAYERAIAEALREDARW